MAASEWQSSDPRNFSVRSKECHSWSQGCLCQVFYHHHKCKILLESWNQLSFEKFDVGQSASEINAHCFRNRLSSDCDRRTQTWMFRACVLLKAGQTFLNLLNARKRQLTNLLATASVISWAFSDTAARLKSQNQVPKFWSCIRMRTLHTPQLQFG